MAWLGLLMGGMTVGLVVAAPLGPVNVICIERTLRHGWRSGALAGSGAVLGDGLFAVIAAFGLTAVIDLAADYEKWLEIVGGLLLLTYAAYGFLSAPGESIDDSPAGAAGEATTRAAAACFVLTVSNPATMFGFVVIFGSVLDPTSFAGNYLAAGVLAGAVALGSMLWWFGLAQFVVRFRKNVARHQLQRINYGVTILIAGFALAILAHALLGG